MYFFTNMIFAILPRFIYKHETAGSPFMYLYKNQITCLCTNLFMIGLAKNPVLKIYHSLHLHINNIFYLGHGFSTSMTWRVEIKSRRAQINMNNLLKIIKWSWKLKYFKHSSNDDICTEIRYYMADVCSVLLN